MRPSGRPVRAGMVIDVDAAKETTLTALACRPVTCANVRRHACQQQVHGQGREIGASPKGSWRFDRVGSGQDSTAARPGPSGRLLAPPAVAFGGLMTLAPPTPTDDRRAGPDAGRSPGREPRL